MALAEKRWQRESQRGIHYLLLSHSMCPQTSDVYACELRIVSGALLPHSVLVYLNMNSFLLFLGSILSYLKAI